MHLKEWPLHRFCCSDSDSWPQFSSVQLLSCVWLFETPWTAARQASVSVTNSLSLLKLMSITSVMPSNHLILCLPLFFPPSIFPCIRVFSNESVLCIRWPKYWSFCFSISPSNEYSGLISFRMDWLDLLAILAPERDAKTGHFLLFSLALPYSKWLVAFKDFSLFLFCFFCLFGFGLVLCTPSLADILGSDPVEFNIVYCQSILGRLVF